MILHVYTRVSLKIKRWSDHWYALYIIYILIIYTIYMNTRFFFAWKEDFFRHSFKNPKIQHQGQFVLITRGVRKARLWQPADPRCEGRSASSWPASSAIWSPPRPLFGCRAAWRVGSQGRRGRPAKPLTPLSAAPLSTWEDQKICNAKFGLKKSL